MEGLTLRSVAWKTRGKGDQIEDDDFWDLAGNIYDKALDALLALKE